MPRTKLVWPRSRCAGDRPRQQRRGPPVQVLAVEHPLRRAPALVELGERQPRRQHRVLDVEQPIVARRQAARLGEPALGARIGRVDADVDDLGQLEAPFAHDAEALLVPVGVGDDVDRDVDAERAREFERLEVAAERNALAELASAPPRRSPRCRGTCRSRPSFFQNWNTSLLRKQHVAARLEVVAACGCPRARSPRRSRSRARPG